MWPPVHLLSRRPRQRRRSTRGCCPRRERRQQRASWHRGRQSQVSDTKRGWCTRGIATRRRCVAAICRAAGPALALLGAATARLRWRAVRLVSVAAVHASQALAPGDAAALRLRLRLPAHREGLSAIIRLPAHTFIWRAPPNCWHVVITLAHSAPVSRSGISRVLAQAASAGGQARRRRRVGPARRRGRAQHAGAVQAERLAPRTGGDWRRVANLPTSTWKLCRGAVLLRRAQLTSLTVVVTHVTRPRPAAVATARRQGSVGRRRQRWRPPSLAWVHRRRRRRSAPRAGQHAWPRAAGRHAAEE